MGCIQFNYHVSSSFHFPGRHPFAKNPMSMYASLEGEVMKIDELSMKMEFCKSQLIPQGNPISLSTKMHGPKKLDINLKQINLQYYITYITYITYIAEKRSKNKRRPPWQLLSKWNGSGDHRDQSCIGLRYKTQINVLHAEDSAEVVSPLSAWDLDLVQEPGQPTLAASMMPKKTKLQTPHISIDA